MNTSTENYFEIRPAVAGEAGYLSELAMRSKAHWGYSPDFMSACREELSYTAEQTESKQFRFGVAEIDSTVIGFHAIEHLGDGLFELEALFVEPDWIGHGIGRALIEDACNSALLLGGTRMQIQGDPNADAFYRAAGGVLTGTRESGSIPGRFLPTFEIKLERCSD
jgi:GNAT superfamily N-acetyltransferase